MIDLHSHTLASDGERSPEALVHLARSEGVTRLAITDHDTVAGIAAARAAAGSALEIVSGIEMSAWLNGREVHILGHFLDDGDPQVAQVSVRLSAERRQRMQAMLAKLSAMGITLGMAEVEAQAGSANLGRPHLAKALVERGLCVDVKEAFSRFLGEGKPACVDRAHAPASAAIDLIRHAGGTATLAHPGSSKVERHEIAELREARLVGLEVFHSDHGPSQREKYLAIARELDLVPTAGSDFHGPRITPGRKPGSPSMDPGEFERLRARAGR